MMEYDNEKYLTFYPNNGEPFDGATVLLDRWWAVHPEKGLPVFKGTSPQCNGNEAVAKSIFRMYPWASVEFVPVAYVSLNYD